MTKSDKLVKKSSKLYHQGKFQKAKGYIERAVKEVEKEFGTDHLNYPIMLNNLAEIHNQLGEHDKAELLYCIVLEKLEKLVGKDSLKYATALSNLALVYEARGQIEEAKNLLHNALQIFEKVVGTDQPSYKTTMNQLSRLNKYGS